MLKEKLGLDAVLVCPKAGVVAVDPKRLPPVGVPNPVKKNNKKII